MDGHERATDLGVRGRIDLAALDTAKELVQIIEATLAAVEGRSLVAHEVPARATHGLLLRVVHGGAVVGLRGVMVVASLTILVGLAKRAGISTTDMPIVIIEARRS